LQIVVEDDLRALLQMPARPYADFYPFDGSPYYDLSRREVVRLLTFSGTVSGAAFLWTPGTNVFLTAGAIDFSPPASVLPDFGTAFTVDYTYSRLGSAAASNAVNWAGLINTRDLGSAFPWGSTTVEGLNYNDLAQFGQALLAGHWACESLANADIENAEKYRRGTVIVDDTKKSSDWQTQADRFHTQYKKYLVLLRGEMRLFDTIQQSDLSKVFAAQGFWDPNLRGLATNIFGGSFF
jgi:hypothetical protein